MTRSELARSWAIPAVVGFVALVCLGVHPAALPIVYAVVAASSVPITISALRRGWLTRGFAVGFVVLIAFSTLAMWLRSRTHPDHPAAGEAFALVAGLLVLVAIGFIVRNRRGQDFWDVVADGGIVAMGTWLVVWVAMVRKQLNDNYTASPALTVLRSAFAPIGSVMLCLLVVMVWGNSRRPRALIKVAVAVAVVFVSGLLRSLHNSGHIADHDRLAATLAMIAIAFVYAAVLDPSVTELVHRQPEGQPRGLSMRVMVTTMALIVPIIVMSATSPTSSADRVVRILSMTALSFMVVARIVQALRANSASQHELLRGAQTDALTGLPNRSLLLEHMNATLRESFKRHDHPTVFFIDLDRFKNINDSLGHAAGDRVLCTIADRLRLTVPDRATVARISGDEYVVFDPSSPSLNDAMELADRLLSTFGEPIPLSHGDVFVTASIGVARSDPQSTRTADVLLRHADTAMYQAKDAGRNCVAMFDESMHERVAHRLTVETALFRALDRRELKLYYQPILDVSVGDVIGFEALMRWQQGDGTIVSPAEFIPIAEETGVINQIGSWALDEALGQMRTWIDDSVCSSLCTISVNVSPRQLADPNLPTIVNDALLNARMSPNQLWLEVTEGIMISEPELALATLRRLRSLGVRVAMDDFGTGYSSLSLLQKFPLQRIKIDKAFVHGCADNANDRSLVRTIIAMGSSLGLDMVAEGVETVQQLQVLGELGCTKAQGYLISRPLPPDAMRSTVAALSRMDSWPGFPKPRQVQPVA